MNNKNRKMLLEIYKNPTSSKVIWTKCESFLISLGVKVTQGNGSRVRLSYKGKVAGIHSPHPNKEMVKGAVESVRKFLSLIGVKP